VRACGRLLLQPWRERKSLLGAGIDTNANDSRFKRLDAATKIWAAGVEASPLGRIIARAAGAEVDRADACKSFRLHAPRTPGSLRDWRFDEPRPPSGTSAGRHPIRPPRRLHDRAPT